MTPIGRIYQTNSKDFEMAAAAALELGADGIAWTLPVSQGFLELTRRAGLSAWVWYQAARTDDSAQWTHSPQHGEWLRRFPGFEGAHPAIVGGYRGLNRVASADAAEREFRGLLGRLQPDGVLLADIQGPPMGCGCGNLICRSWDNSPGEAVAETTYANPEVLFPLAFYRRVRDLGRVVPVLCPECERGISLDGVSDPDGPEGTDLCQGVGCQSPCADLFWPRLLQGFRGEAAEIGLLLLTDALEKKHAVYGEPRAWPLRAHRHYGSDLIPTVEPSDASRFERCIIATAAPQNAFPVPMPAGFTPSIPAIRCSGH